MQPLNCRLSCKRRDVSREREKISVLLSQHKNRIFPMEAERINAIGNQLTSLTERTLELRGYL